MANCCKHLLISFLLLRRIAAKSCLLAFCYYSKSLLLQSLLINFLVTLQQILHLYLSVCVCDPIHTIVCIINGEQIGSNTSIAKCGTTRHLRAKFHYLLLMHSDISKVSFLSLAFLSRLLYPNMIICQIGVLNVFSTSTHT